MVKRYQSKVGLCYQVLLLGPGPQSTNTQEVVSCRQHGGHITRCRTALFYTADRYLSCLFVVAAVVGEHGVYELYKYAKQNEEEEERDEKRSINT